MARLRASPGRGDIVWVDLNHERGTEIRKIRPAVVISNDSCNRYGTRVVVQPIAGNINSLYPAEALVQMNSRTARVLGDQIRSVDKSRLGSKIGALSPEELLNDRGSRPTEPLIFDPESRGFVPTFMSFNDSGDEYRDSAG